MVKRGQIRRSQDSRDLEICSNYAQPSVMSSLIECASKNDSFVLERNLAVSKNVNFFYCFHDYPWVKPA